MKYLSFLVLTLLMWSSCTKTPDNNNNTNTTEDCSNSFGTLGSFTDSRDGIEYKTVTIGSQTWMAENLRFDATNSYLHADNPCTQYGRLYDWHTMMNGAASSNTSPSGVQGLCPAGWHLPSDAEWNELEITLGMAPADATVIGFRGNHGALLKSDYDWNNNGNGSNANGFNVLPTGYAGGSPSVLYGLNLETYFLTSTEFSSSQAWDRNIDESHDGILRSYDIDKVAQMACRCVQD